MTKVDGTPLTTGPVTAYRIIDGGERTAVTGSVDLRADGHCNFAASAADMNGSHISFAFYAATAVPLEKTVTTTAADPDDGAAFGLTDLVGGMVAANAVRNVTLLSLEPGPTVVDALGSELTGLTLGEVLSALAVNTFGARTGAGTRTIAAAMSGAADYVISAERVSETEITMTLKIPVRA